MTGAPEYGDLSYTLAGVRRQNPYDRRRRFAQQMMQSGMDFSPVQHPLQGAARLAQALVGGWMGSKADADEEVAAKKQQEAFATAMSETDPQKRITMIAAVDPQLGARLSGQLAVEQAKLKAQSDGLTAAAGNFGASYGSPSGGPPQGGQLAVPQGTAPGNPGGFANNVGNIRATNINWEGKGAPHNGFETFTTPQAGANAMAQNLRAYVQKNPNMTIAQAISTWAPPNENNTQAYIKGLSEATGINPGMPLAEALSDPVVAAQLMDGIARIEKGGLPQGFTADTFINAGGGNAQQPGAPLTINMTPGGPNNAPQPQIPQGDNVGMPPAPSPQAVSGPVLQAPVVPETPRPVPSPQQIAQYQQRLMTGEFGNDQGAVNRARAALEAEIDRDWSVRRDQDKMRYTQAQEAYKDQRDRNQPSRNEVEKLHAARSDAAAIVSALDDFSREFKNTGTWGAIKSVAGYNTPVNTAYNAAALLAKGEQLFHLGVLNGPDLAVIQRTLSDPSTFKGAQTSTEDMQAAVNKVVNLLQVRLGAREKQLGLPVTNVRQFAAEVRGATPPSPDAPPPATSFVGPDGRVVSMADIEETARNRGMDAAAVIQRLQLRAVR